MKAITKCHIKAFKTVVYMLCGNLLAIAGDILWMYHDISKNGVNFTYQVVLALFLVALFCNLIAVWKEHKKLVKSIRACTLQEALQKQAHKNRLLKKKDK